jgi:hypothetical protein
MTTAASPGPEVDIAEFLNRCLTTSDWWVAEENRPSSAAFKQPDFSTDIQSIAKTVEYTLGRFPAGCGLVSFNYGDAKLVGFIARQEADPEYPDNQAHANVYNPQPQGSKRKTMAQKLAQKCKILRAPSFAS